MTRDERIIFMYLDHGAFSLQSAKKSLSKKKSTKKSKHSEFQAWKKKTKNDTLEWIEANTAEHQIVFAISGDQYTLKYPSSKVPSRLEIFCATTLSILFLH